MTPTSEILTFRASVIDTPRFKMAFANLQIARQSLRDEILQLLKNLSAADTAIAISLEGSTDHLLSLSNEEWEIVFPKLATLASANPFITGYLIEKMPTLKFWGMLDPVLDFLLCVKNYSARASGYLVGSKASQNDDVEDTISKVGVQYYEALLDHVQSRHETLETAAIYVMIHAQRVSSTVSQEQIPNFVDFTCRFLAKYGLESTVAMLKNSHNLFRCSPPEDLEPVCESVSKYGNDYLCYFLETTCGNLSNPRLLSVDLSVDRKMIELLQPGTPEAEALCYPEVFANPQRGALMRSWAGLSMPTKQNILWQLGLACLRDHLRNFWASTGVRETLGTITNGKWDDHWAYCNRRLDTRNLREIVSELVAHHFTRGQIQSLVKSDRDLFSRSSNMQCPERACKVIDAILMSTDQQQLNADLKIIKSYIQGDIRPLRESYSKEEIFVETWSRDPWVDYGRSDELFSCTSIGDASAMHAPAILVDPNLSNLEVWLNGHRVGRVHLSLVLREGDEPFLMVDALEGSERMIQSPRRVKRIVDAIRDYANYVGLNSICFNSLIAYNNTPKKFIGQLKKMFETKQEYVYFRRLIVDPKIYGVLPFPMRPFLEAFDARAEGMVSTLHLVD
jgi:hypothetical protein